MEATLKKAREAHKTRLLPKKIVQEPFRLPTLKVSIPSHFFKSPEFINSSWDHIYM